MAVRVVHYEQAMKEGYRFSKCEGWVSSFLTAHQHITRKMRGLHQILRVSWTVNSTNDWVLDKAGVSRNLLESVKAEKLMYFGHVMRKNFREFREADNGRNNTGILHKRQTENNSTGVCMDRHPATSLITSSQPPTLLLTADVYDLPTGTVSLCLAVDSARTAVVLSTTPARQSGTRCLMNLEILTVLIVLNGSRKQFSLAATSVSSALEVIL